MSMSESKQYPNPNHTLDSNITRYIIRTSNHSSYDQSLETRIYCRIARLGLHEASDMSVEQGSRCRTTGNRAGTSSATHTVPSLQHYCQHSSQCNSAQTLPQMDCHCPDPWAPNAVLAAAQNKLDLRTAIPSSGRSSTQELGRGAGPR